MPHIHLEATPNAMANTDVILVLRDLVKQLTSFETIDPASIKAYYTLREVYVMGDGAPRGFVHCTVSIVSGREQDLKERIAQGMSDVLHKYFDRMRDLHQAGITLELREMERETYLK